MTKTQNKKQKARNYNMARLEVAAMKMDEELFPQATRPASRSARHHALMWMAVVGGLCSGRS